MHRLSPLSVRAMGALAYPRKSEWRGRVGDLYCLASPGQSDRTKQVLCIYLYLPFKRQRTLSDAQSTEQMSSASFFSSVRREEFFVGE